MPQVSGASGLFTLHLDPRVLIGSVDDNRDIPRSRVLFHAFQEVQAGHIGKIDIDYNNQWHGQVHKGETVRGRLCHDHVVLEALEKDAGVELAHRPAIDYQDDLLFCLDLLFFFSGLRHDDSAVVPLAKNFVSEVRKEKPDCCPDKFKFKHARKK